MLWMVEIENSLRRTRRLFIQRVYSVFWFFWHKDTSETNLSRDITVLVSLVNKTEKLHEGARDTGIIDEVWVIPVSY